MRRAETLVEQRPALEQGGPIQEARTMSHCGQYPDSAGEINAEQTVSGWRSIGELAKKLVEDAKCGQPK